jgi:hypothetical protein
MKSAQTFTSAVLGLAVVLAPWSSAFADRHHHESHDRYRVERGERNYYYGRRPYYGWGWPWYRPAVSFTYVHEPDYSYNDDYGTAYRGRSIEAAVQIELAKRGYYHGPVDGDIGPGSRAAIRAYQVDRGLRVTGRIDGGLLRALRL